MVVEPFLSVNFAQCLSGQLFYKCLSRQDVRVFQCQGGPGGLVGQGNLGGYVGPGGPGRPGGGGGKLCEKIPRSRVR